MTIEARHIHLVRHGQSTWNVERRLQGQTVHPPLTEQGWADASRAAATLVELVGDASCAIDSSDLRRAAQTAGVIAKALSTPGRPLAVRHTVALREQHLGSLQGRLTEQLAPEPVPEGRHISEVRWGGNGESIADVHLRLRRYFAEVLPTAPEHLIVVTHGDTLRVARAVLVGASHRDVEWDVVENGAVITLPAPQEV